MGRYIVSVSVNTDTLDIDDSKGAAELAVYEAIHDAAQIDSDQMSTIGCEVDDSEEEV